MFTSQEILQERYQLQQTLGRTAARRQTGLVRLGGSVPTE